MLITVSNKIYYDAYYFAIHKCLEHKLSWAIDKKSRMMNG